MLPDLDFLALRFARGIDADQLPHSIPALTIDRRIVLARGLTRFEERWHAAHELFHALESGPDQRPLIGTGDPVLAAEEAAADAFRDDLLMPARAVLDALSDDLTPEEWEMAFGVPIGLLAARAGRIRALWAA